MDIPTLVVGHGHDLLHPLDDAQALAREMPNTAFLRARSIMEARTKPARVVAALDAFLTASWEPRPVAGARVES
jgi:pimeloyl-ACP methyl ester carboxylesterase